MLANIPQRKEGKLVAYVVDIPTGLAYVWILLGFVTAGLLLYVGFMAAAFRIALFRRFKEWPKISKIALFSGPLLLALGLYFSTIQISYSMLIPLVVYYSITTFGSRAVALKFDKPPS
jgi:hypothetical protein